MGRTGELGGLWINGLDHDWINKKFKFSVRDSQLEFLKHLT